MKTINARSGVLLPLFLLMGSLLSAQLAFTPAADRLSGTSFSFFPVGIEDVNGDGLDDLVRLQNGVALWVDYQRPGRTQLEAQAIEAFDAPVEPQWALSLADYDKDGARDLLIAGARDDVKLLRQVSSERFELGPRLLAPDLFAQNVNWVDIDNDGWVDAFVCHDLGESRIWSNQADGTFATADQWIDMSSDPPSDKSGNYGSIWTDFDNDGDLDLYLVKCSSFAPADPTDGRRINALFVNDGQGQFTEAASQYGLRLGAQSWTANFQDIDNDGDLDCFVNNHYEDSQLLLNDGQGHFGDATQAAGLTGIQAGLQGFFRDFDNDGWVDLLVLGIENHYLYRNRGDGRFERQGSEILGGDEVLLSGTLGDLNHDGFLDLYATFHLGEPFFRPDQLWLNRGNDNNFVAIRLRGTASNSDGIGARLELYGTWGRQIREVRTGESYGIHTSLTQHFGLGQATQIDSLLIRWPSGQVDRYEALPTNQFIQVEEGGCRSPDAALSLVGSTNLCQGDSLVLSVPPGNTYRWSTGETGASIVVRQSGTYHVEVRDGGACVGLSPKVEVEVSPDIPSISTDFGIVDKCVGEALVLRSSQSEDIEWSTGETSVEIAVVDPGAYTIAVEDACGRFHSEPIEVRDLPEVVLPLVTGDTLDISGSGLLRAEGDSLLWYDRELGGDPLATGPLFQTPVTAASTTYWVENIVANPLPSLRGGKTNRENGSGPLNADEDFRYLTFRVDRPLRLRSFKVYAETAGERTIRFFNRQQNEVLYVVERMIPAGESRLDLDLFLPVSTEIWVAARGDDGLYADTEKSILSFPYSLGPYAAITGSLDGSYYFFYDWEIEPAPIFCRSARVPVELNISTGLGSAPRDFTPRFFPNPARDRLYLEWEEEAVVQVRIYDPWGRSWYEAMTAPGAVVIEQWPRGVYWVQISGPEGVYTEKLLLH